MIEHPALDALHAMLGACRLRATFFAKPILCKNEQLDFDGRHRLMFHFVAAGECLLQLEGTGSCTKLAVGDLAVVAHGRAHTLSVGGSSIAIDARAAHVADAAATATLICGAFEFEQLDRNLLLEALPDSIVIDREYGAERSSLHRLVDLLALETQDQSNTCQLVLDQLTTTLFAMVVRHYARACCLPRGIFAALTDPRLQPVLVALHAHLGDPWRSGQLAALAGMSRSAFALHFKRVLGMSLRAYVTHWRMTHADAMLRADARRSVAQIAESLGYSTEASFRRAFKRVFGIGPGRVRRAPGFNHCPPRAPAPTVLVGAA